MEYHAPNTVCVLGYAAIHKDDSIHMRYGKMMVVLEVDKTTGVVVKFQMNSICNLTSDYVASLVEGLSITTEFSNIEQRIKFHYLGNSPSVILVALRDARNKLLLT